MLKINIDTIKKITDKEFADGVGLEEYDYGARIFTILKLGGGKLIDELAPRIILTYLRTTML